LKQTATAIRTDRPAASRSGQTLGSRLLRQWELQLMVIPALILILVFSYFPMYGVIIAFQDYSVFKGFWASPWVGFKHFNEFFQSPELGLVMRNTLVISLLKLLIGFPAPILLAIMLNEVRNLLFKRVVQTVSYLPYFLSWVIVANFAIALLSTDNGSVNILLEKLKVIDEPIPYLSVLEYFWTIIVSTNVWKDTLLRGIDNAISGVFSDLPKEY